MRIPAPERKADAHATLNCPSCQTCLLIAPWSCCVRLRLRPTRFAARLSRPCQFDGGTRPLRTRASRQDARGLGVRRGTSWLTSRRSWAPCPEEARPHRIQGPDPPGAGVSAREDLVRQRARRRVPAWLLIPDAILRSKVRARVLCLHQTVAIGKDEPAGLGEPRLDYASELAERGSSRSPRSPNFGEPARRLRHGVRQRSMKAIWNNMRAIDVLRVSMRSTPADRRSATPWAATTRSSRRCSTRDQGRRLLVRLQRLPLLLQGNIAGWSHKGYMPRLKDRYTST